MLVLSACGEDQRPIETEDPEEEVITYAALNPVSKDFQRSINLFNSTHEGLRLEVRDYSDENGLERLRTELVLGRVPDIMEMHYYGKDGPRVAATRDFYYVVPGSYTEAEDEYWMPYRQMAQKGYLEDLWPYIENDPELGRDGVLQAPLKATELNGSLFILFQKVTTFTLTGRESVVGNRTGWTLDELMDVFASMPEGSSILRYNITRQEVFFNLLRYSLDQYVNRETGDCYFDGQGFRDLIVFLENFPDEVSYEKPEDTDYENIQNIKYGRQLLEGKMIDWPRDIGFSDAIWQERAAFPGYPTADGSPGNFFYPVGDILSMSANCKHKEAAWDFIRDRLLKTVLTESIPLKPFTNTPINLHDYELLIRGEEMEAKRYAVDYPENPTKYFATREHFDYGPPIYLMHLLNDEDIQRFGDLIDQTTQLYWPDDDLTTIVWEVLTAYFAGARDLDQTIQMLNNRVGLYLKEQM